MSKENQRNIGFMTLLIGGIVAVFLLEFVAPTELLDYGLVPRTQRGLLGILTMPFLHASFSHMLGNLTSLVVLLSFMMVFHPKRLIGSVISIVFLGGLLLWMLGRPASHVGASGLIYGLAGFMLVAGFAHRRFLEIVGSIAVAFLYGASLFSGLLPIHPGVSWDGHLAGAVAGAIIGLTSRPEQPAKLNV
jgi:membrane associated rhomboid family serine protease